MLLHEFFPCTIYSAAVVFAHRLEAGRNAVFATMQRVGGLNPLTNDEYARRAVADVEAKWSEDAHGPRSNYGPAFTVVTRGHFTATPII